MRVFLLRVTLLLLACSLAIGLARANIDDTAQEKRVALVVGNAAYKQGVLVNPVNDARAMAKKLSDLGFTVILKENIKVKELGSVYREFRSRIVPGGVALMFYAGHGLQFKGQNYFPAVDSDITSEEDVPLQSLNLGQILDNMEESKAGVSLVFLDACRDNPFSRRFRSAARGLAKVDAASGTLVHYATKPGSVAADGDGQNGTCTEALLAQIGEAGKPVELMLKDVTNRVVRKTNGKQEPWIEGSLRGDFYFIYPGAITVSAQQSRADPEVEAWEAAKKSNNVEAVEAYLKEYPFGMYAAAARTMLAGIKKTVSSSPIEPSRPVAATPSALPTDKQVFNGLEWDESDNGTDINWYEAKQYCASKGNGWRLPTTGELQNSYQTGYPAPCGPWTCKLSSKSWLTGGRFWSSDTNGSSEAWLVFLFNGNGSRAVERAEFRFRDRALCVRNIDVTGQRSDGEVTRRE